MGRLLEFVASGTVLYVVFAFLAILVVIIAWKLPLVISWVFWPFRFVWGKLTASKYGSKITASRPYLWLQKQQYDPPPKPLTWWISRGAVILFFWAVISAMVWMHGSRYGLETAAQRPLGLVSAPVMADSGEAMQLRGDLFACKAELAQVRLPEVPSRPVEIVTPVPVLLPVNPTETIKAVQPLKAFRTVCKPEWLCKVDKTLGLGK